MLLAVTKYSLQIEEVRVRTQTFVESYRSPRKTILATHHF